MPRLQTEPTNAPRTYWKDLKALVSWNSPEAGHRWPLFKSILLRSVRIKLTKDEATVLPLRVRPAFIVLNFLDLTILAFLGFHPRGQDWVKLNDKILHFLCFFIATGLFYCIFDVDEAARRAWFWRYASLNLTFFTCFLVGSIGSEFVQSLLPYKTFQWGDVIANLLGSGLGLFLSYHFEARYRMRREIESLYQPLDAEDYEDDDLLFDENEDDIEIGRRAPQRAASPADPKAKKGIGKHVYFGHAAKSASADDSATQTQPFSIGDDTAAAEDDSASKAGRS